MVGEIGKSSNPLQKILTPKPTALTPYLGGGSSSPGRSSGGGSSRGGGGGKSREPVVIIRGNEVLINGVGSSVVPGKQAEFLAKQGLSGSSYMSALQQAQAQDKAYKVQQEQAAKQQQAEVNAMREQAQRKAQQNFMAKLGVKENVLTKQLEQGRTKSYMPYLETKKIGSFKAGGKNIPVTDLFYVDPNTGQQRKATQKEKAQFKADNPKELIATNESKFDTLSKRYLPKYVEQVPIIFKDFAKSYGKGFLKSDIFLNDLYSSIYGKGPIATELKKVIPSKTPFAAMTYNNKFLNLLTKTSPETRKEVLKKVIEYNPNVLQDPDVQNFMITTSLGGLGAAGKAGASVVKLAVRGMGAKQAYDTYKNPTDYNLALLGLYAAPEVSRGVRNIKTRKDILVANVGELVPLENRLSQIDKIVNNQGKRIETITSKPSKKAGITNAKKNNVDYTYGKPIQFATYKIGKIYPTSEYFLTGKGTRLQKALKKGVVQITDARVQSNANSLLRQIREDTLRQGRTSEANIKRLYELAQEEANRLGKPVLTISPKRLRGFWQPEQELVKVFPKKYKPSSLNFAGWTETGHRIYTDKGNFRNISDFVKSKFNVKKKQLSYWEKIANDKYDYLKGKMNIRGEYLSHGRKHLLPMGKYNKYYTYHDITKVGDVESFSKFEHGQTAYDLWKSGKFPDKSIYKRPYKEQKRIAQAYAWHTEAVFNLRSLFKDLVSEEKSAKRVIKASVVSKYNPHLQNVATLDRLDLTRFPDAVGKIDYRRLSKEALTRLFGSEENALRQNAWKLNMKTVPKSLVRKTFGTSRNIKSIILRQRRTMIKKVPRITRLEKIRNIPDKRIKSSVDKLFQGKLTKNEGLNLARLISLKTGRRYTLSSLKKDTSKYFSAKKSRENKYQNKIKRYEKSSAYKSSYKPEYKPGYKPGYQPSYKPGYKPSHKPSFRTRPRRLGVSLTKKEMKVPQKRKVFYDVYAKPIKTLSGKKAKKYLKVNTGSLSKSTAEDLRNYITDTSLSRTAILVPSKNKPGKIGIKIPKGYATKTKSKFRTYRIVRGRKVPLPKGRVIERSSFILDTRQEKARIDLRKRIKQIQRPTKSINSQNYLKKGSKAAKLRMAKLRSMRR